MKFLSSRHLMVTGQLITLYKIYNWKDMHYVKTLFLTSILCVLLNMDANSQQPARNYDAEWKKVTDLIAKRLPQSALQEVKKIYALAKKEKQDAQVIKALVYMDDLQSETREGNDILSIKELEKEIAVSKEPATSILYSMLASKYWRYYNQHRWNMYDRTKTAVSFKKEDISTWDADDFHKTISSFSVRLTIFVLNSILSPSRTKRGALGCNINCFCVMISLVLRPNAASFV